MRRISLAVLAMGACFAAARAQPVEGMYCLRGPGQDFTMLVVRQLPTQQLMFGLTQWSGGRNFAVSGVAAARGGFWRFEQGMRAPDPAARCAATLGRTPEGGLSFATDARARCEAWGGAGMAQPQSLRFPPESRVGPAPDAFVGEALQRLDCARPPAAAPPSPPPTLVEFPAAAPGVARGMMRISISCSSPRTASLALVFFDHEGPLRLFDFREFLGERAPARGLPLSLLRAEGAGGAADIRLPARGIRPGPDMYVLELEPATAAARQGLAAVLRALAAAPATLVWHQASAEPGRPPARITAAIDGEEAAALPALLAQCGEP